MSFLVWLVLGLASGWLAWFVMKGGYSMRGDIGLGILGALIGGFLASSLFQGDATVPVFMSALVGAILLLAIPRVMRRGKLRSTW